MTTSISNNTAVEGRIQYRSEHPESPNMEIVSRFINYKIGSDSFSAQLLLLGDWKLGEQVSFF